MEHPQMSCGPADHGIPAEHGIEVALPQWLLVLDDYLHVHFQIPATRAGKITARCFLFIMAIMQARRCPFATDCKY
jgi:hypothetical protein